MQALEEMSLETLQTASLPQGVDQADGHSLSAGSRGRDCSELLSISMALSGSLLRSTATLRNENSSIAPPGAARWLLLNL